MTLSSLCVTSNRTSNTNEQIYSIVVHSKKNRRRWLDRRRRYIRSRGKLLPRKRGVSSVKPPPPKWLTLGRQRWATSMCNQGEIIGKGYCFCQEVLMELKLNCQFKSYSKYTLHIVIDGFMFTMKNVHIYLWCINLLWNFVNFYFPLSFLKCTWLYGMYNCSNFWNQSQVFQFLVSPLFCETFNLDQLWEYLLFVNMCLSHAIM